MTDHKPPRVVETHASVLVFYDDVVLKYKKALHLPFVDFTNIEQRRKACDSEVASNRRLSPDVYLGVADVKMGAELLDHGVVMRRLPDGRSLASMAASGDPVLTVQLPRLARRLSSFHAGAERSEEIDAGGRPSAIARTWRRCFDVLRPFAAALGETYPLEHIEDLATRYLRGRGPLFEERIAGGRVCDAHGDLLASDVFLLDDGPRVLDCIDFDDELRHIDVVADIAFLAMDLEHLGAPAVARQFVREYREAAGDEFPATLLHHYCAQRAVIRAEVACIRSTQRSTAGEQSSAAAGDRAQARSLLALAQDHLHAGRVIVGVVSGLPGTGKTTLARAAGEQLGWPVLRSDEVRRDLVGRPDDAGPLTASFEAGPYTPATTARTYRTMLERAGQFIVRGQPVILDATFSDPAFRRAAEELADTTTSDLVVLRCAVSPRAAEARVRARRQRGGDVSGADEGVVRAMAATVVPWRGAVTVDTEHGTHDDHVAAAMRALRECRSPPPTGGGSNPWLGTLASTDAARLG